VLLLKGGAVLIELRILVMRYPRVAMTSLICIAMTFPPSYDERIDLHAFGILLSEDVEALHDRPPPGHQCGETRAAS